MIKDDLHRDSLFLVESSSNESYHSAIISSTQRLASTLSNEFIVLLRQRGFDI